MADVPFHENVSRIPGLILADRSTHNMLSHWFLHPQAASGRIRANGYKGCLPLLAYGQPY